MTESAFQETQQQESKSHTGAAVEVVQEGPSWLVNSKGHPLGLQITRECVRNSPETFNGNFRSGVLVIDK